MVIPPSLVSHLIISGQLVMVNRCACAGNSRMASDGQSDAAIPLAARSRIGSSLPALLGTRTWANAISSNPRVVHGAEQPRRRSLLLQRGGEERGAASPLQPDCVPRINAHKHDLSPLLFIRFSCARFLSDLFIFVLSLFLGLDENQTRGSSAVNPVPHSSPGNNNEKCR